MSNGPFEWGEWLNLAISIALFGWMFWAFARRRRKVGVVKDGPATEPYRIYTRDHDLTLPACEVVQTLREKGLDRAKGWSLLNPEIWQIKIAAARDIFSRTDAEGVLRQRLADIFAQPSTASDWAICLLVDQSGSMRDDPMLHVAASVRCLSDMLRDFGVAMGILGFSTVGWKGGKPREDWLSNGRPKRPGRLCGLLHIVYQPIGAELAEPDWETMLHPDILRENIDGEAIEWAASELAAYPARHRLLIVISDGAPVDASTLQVNGPNYLARHIKSVIAATEARDDLTLAAIGVNYRVDKYYRLSRVAEELADIPAALCDLIDEAVRSEMEPR